MIQAFDNIQVLLGITNSIFMDFFQFSYSTEIYKVLTIFSWEKIYDRKQRFVTELLENLNNSTRIAGLLKRMQDGSLGES